MRSKSTSVGKCFWMSHMQSHPHMHAEWKSLSKQKPLKEMPQETSWGSRDLLPKFHKSFRGQVKKLQCAITFKSRYACIPQYFYHHVRVDYLVYPCWNSKKQLCFNAGQTRCLTFVMCGVETLITRHIQLLHSKNRGDTAKAALQCRESQESWLRTVCSENYRNPFPNNSCTKYYFSMSLSNQQ